MTTETLERTSTEFDTRVKGRRIRGLGIRKESFPTSTEEVKIKDVSEEDREIIAERGYTLNKELGENQGATRRAYDATRKVGNLKLEGVLKIPKREEDVVSLNALINRSKRNLDLQEAMISGRLKHAGIARTLDSFQLSDERTVNYEDKIEGLSLRSFLRRANFEETEKLSETFMPVISALVYAHEKGILHRDITPNNLIIPSSEKTGAVITDWQNAAYEKDIENLAMPTRGGTSYTHPILLNSLMTGNLARATKRMDVYSLGAVLYEAITGEKAFDYNIVFDENGKEIAIGNNKVKIGLRDGNKDLETITLEHHEANLKKAEKVMKSRKVPKKLIALISDMLTTDTKRELYDMSQVQTRFIEATDTRKQEIKKNIGRYIRNSLIAAGVCTGICLGVYFGRYMDKLPAPSRETTLSDVMRGQSRLREFAIGNTDAAASLRVGGSARDEFQRYISEAERRRTEIEGDFEKELEYANRSGIQVDKRLTSALIRSIILEKDKGKIKENGREAYTLVPIEYIRANFSTSLRFDEKRDLDSFRSKMWMSRYIQNRFQFGDSVEDVYAKSLCSQEEIDLAKSKTQHSHMIKNLRDRGFKGMDGNFIPIGEIASSNYTNFEYFARETLTDNKESTYQISRVIPGYAENLNPIKRRIIDRAIALYNITDGEGKLDFVKYRSPIANTNQNPQASSDQAVRDTFNPEVRD